MSRSVVAQASAKARAAVLWAFVTAAAIFAALIFVWITHNSEQQRVYERLLEAHRAADLILLADERLTMSANMAAATGEKVWIERYDQNIPLIDDGIAEVCLSALVLTRLLDDLE